MSDFLQEIKETLLELVGKSIASLPGILFAIFVLLVVRYVAGFVKRLSSRVARKALKSRSLQTLIAQTSYVLTWTAGILVACISAFPGLELGDIIALLGLGSVAVGFAFQDIFKNFLAGILLLLQEPFSLGDQIIVADYEGTVDSIALRSTQIRTYQGELIVMPNSIVFTSPVQVLTKKPHRRTDLEIGVDYNTPLPMARDTLLNALNDIDGVQLDPRPEVDIVGFGDSSINLVVRYWTAPQKAKVRRTMTQVMIALKQACDRKDISIPYPIRTVYMFDQEKFDDHTASSNGREQPQSTPSSAD
ncbi:Small-conductance mechanosensitive channel [Acaryochloris thomasi RCC1774]|uniref:Small-conductance mechanosensitive channel n=1 Tax=Acaryochloris thomasi RCC1774 TaxID=1764569 RepID=A0A2W1JZ20_9CYAN|nr:mechanosensitive ion channel family protein [Acaryochloris thomasi]PZD75192.1 Small-conductance mechanosensitive channel [Acaryochloris thomasi RCC1774]